MIPGVSFAIPDAHYDFTRGLADIWIWLIIRNYNLTQQHYKRLITQILCIELNWMLFIILPPLMYVMLLNVHIYMPLNIVASFFCDLNQIVDDNALMLQCCGIMYKWNMGLWDIYDDPLLYNVIKGHT